MTECNDLRLGGTLSDSGITGGLSINDTNLSVADWSSILNTGGVRGSVVAVSGRPGGRVVGDLHGRPRFLTLRLNVHRMGPNFTQPLPPLEQLVKNTDDFMTLISDPFGNYLELDMPDGSSRFLHVVSLDPSEVFQPRSVRSIRSPMVSPWPYWRDSLPEDESIGALTVDSRVPVYDPVFTTSGDGVISSSEWSLTIAGSTGTVVIDVGARTVTDNGVPADNILRVSSRDWAWLNPGANTLTGSGTVKWRNQYA